MALVPFPGKPAPAEPPVQEEVGVSETSARDEKAISPFIGRADDSEEPVEGRMTFLEHLDELRKRITHSVVALLVGFLVAFAFIQQVWDFVFARLAADVPNKALIYTEPSEAFILYIKLAALTGLLIASPYIMWQVWLFIAPGLYAKEKKFAVPFVVFSSALFIGGVAFGHYVVFPLVWRFFAGFTTSSLTFMPRVEPIFGLYVKLMLAFGGIFQMPMLIFVLARLGIVSARFLIRNIKYALLIFFVASAVLTPDGSPITQTLMAAPMMLLYCVGIVVAWLFGKSDPAAVSNG